MIEAHSQFELSRILRNDTNQTNLSHLLDLQNSQYETKES